MTVRPSVAAPVAALACLAAIAAACGPAAAPPDAAAPSSAHTAPAAAAPPPAASADTTALRRAVVRTYADIAFASYTDALRTADALQDAIEAFVADPTDASLADAKSAWLAARDVYGQTEAFRFYGGPIDEPESGVEGLVNAWPLDEAYIDDVDGNPGAGIVNAVAEHPEITAGLLVDLNEVGGEKNIATGYHAIEFLLWGQDLSADGPGARPVTDYVVGVGPNADRRRKVLALEADLLTQHLRIVVDAWDPDELAGYRSGFVRDVDGSLAKVFTGLTELSGGELAGERMAVVYETQDQEDEHSCFSDNTHKDFIAGAQGMANIWRGRYGDVVGTGLDALVADVDPAAAADITAAVDAAVVAMGAIPPPFDQAVMGADDATGRMAVLAAMSSLEQLAARLRSAGAKLGVLGGGGA
ncbi:MAG: hypothetical protein IT332_11830 [Ardenticatenales bacterium]|nr:hypothetical protein [Ardenticatenales bacterium]